MKIKLDNEAVKMLQQLSNLEKKFDSPEWDELTIEDKEKMAGKIVALESRFGAYILALAQYQGLI